MNNSGLDTYTFTENGSFLLIYVDDAGNYGATEATVTWIDTTSPTASVVYDPAITTTGNVLATLTGFSEPGVSVINNG